MGHYTLFERMRPGWPTRIVVVLGSLVVGAIVASALYGAGVVGKERTTTATTTAPTAATCEPFCLPADRPVPR
jgi:hypothetical protein